MKSVVQYSVIDAHSAGAPARVVIGGVLPVPGGTIAEKRIHLMENHDNIRKLLMYEPRGSSEMCGSILMQPCNAQADIGIVFLETGGWPTMCGAGTIGAATVMVDNGYVEPVEPITHITFDTPAGLVTAEVEVAGGQVKGVTIRNVASYMVAPDQALEVTGHGKVSVDIVFGGNYYALVPVSSLGLKVHPEFAEQLVIAGRAIRDSVNRNLTLLDHVSSQNFHVPMVIFTEELNEDGTYRNLVFFGESGVDRSPGGTGTSARMAQRYFRGQQKVGEKFPHESIIGSVFEGVIAETTAIGKVQAIVPTIRGRAHIIAQSTFLLDPEDSFPEGFGVGYASDAAGPTS
ncbi:proline racemase family protein [Mesorhizobium sp. DCY119]|uniref:proline racemase family protein n=1 Tax=Mesorhizobium sp. DCY119 TaxID=2108445 RepID=UPI000E767FC6|nr:proline racemase family protein [Mesorhizobium sp. DCY119]RJG40412.1 proline racemase [Mesorhizobium sp. DCY119]